MSQEEWGIVELMGHVTLAGRVSEVKRFGVELGRVDVPDMRPGADPGAVSKTHYFGGHSLYRYTPCDEQTAREIAARSQLVADDTPFRLEAPREGDGESEDRDDYEDELW